MAGGQNAQSRVGWAELVCAGRRAVVGEEMCSRRFCMPLDLWCLFNKAGKAAMILTLLGWNISSFGRMWWGAVWLSYKLREE